MSSSIHLCESIFSAGDLESFLDFVTEFCINRSLLDDSMEIDHVCYRVETVHEYTRITNELSTYGDVIADSMINGRPITTVKLNQPMKYKNWSISCIEIPCPKAGRPYQAGWEHIEIVIGDQHMGCLNNKSILETFMSKYSEIEFDTRAIDKEINADVSIEIGQYSCKFHCRPLYEVCEFERKHGHDVPVPSDYFSD